MQEDKIRDMKINDLTYDEIVELVRDTLQTIPSDRMSSIQKRWERKIQEAKDESSDPNRIITDLEESLIEYISDVGWPGSTLSIDDVETILFEWISRGPVETIRQGFLLSYLDEGATFPRQLHPPTPEEVGVFSPAELINSKIIEVWENNEYNCE